MKLGSIFLGLDRQNLTAIIHAGLQIDVVRTAQFAGILVLDIARGGESVGRATEAALHRRRFSFRNSHFLNSGPAAAPMGKTPQGRTGKITSASLTGKSRERPEREAKI